MRFRSSTRVLTMLFRSPNLDFDDQLSFRRGVKQLLPEDLTSLQRNSIIVINK